VKRGGGGGGWWGGGFAASEGTNLKFLHKTKR